MPSGEAWRRPRPRPRRGFSYLWLLFSLALSGVALAALGSNWQQAAQRSREAELIFRGEQVQGALQRYHDASPAGQPRLPDRLEALLADQRDGSPRHHLRRLWADPCTGRPDWLLLRDASGQGIVGVRSRAQHPALRRHNTPPPAQPAGPRSDLPPAADGPPRVGDWLFTITPLPVRGATPRHPSP